jgi:hypothetical protein
MVQYKRKTRVNSQGIVEEYGPWRVYGDSRVRNGTAVHEWGTTLDNHGDYCGVAEICGTCPKFKVNGTIMTKQQYLDYLLPQYRLLV